MMVLIQFIRYFLATSKSGSNVYATVAERTCYKRVATLKILSNATANKINETFYIGKR